MAPTDPGAEDPCAYCGRWRWQHGTRHDTCERFREPLPGKPSAFGEDGPVHFTRTIDALAKGPNPRERVAIPEHGKRCPRHHGVVDLISSYAHPCLLCRPDLVPVEFGGGLESG